MIVPLRWEGISQQLKSKWVAWITCKPWIEFFAHVAFFQCATVPCRSVAEIVLFGNQRKGWRRAIGQWVPLVMGVIGTKGRSMQVEGNVTDVRKLPCLDRPTGVLCVLGDQVFREEPQARNQWTLASPMFLPTAGLLTHPMESTTRQTKKHRSQILCR